MTEDTLSAELITEKLGTRFVGRNIIYYPRVASTMDLARREAKIHRYPPICYAHGRGFRSEQVLRRLKLYLSYLYQINYLPVKGNILDSRRASGIEYQVSRLNFIAKSADCR